MGIRSWWRRRRGIELVGRTGVVAEMVSQPTWGRFVDTKFIRINGLKVRYVDSGSGPAVILIHGMGHDLIGWRHTIPALVDAGYRAIAFDLPGFGESEMPQQLGVETYVNFVLAWMDLNCLDKAIIVGNSMGGSIAATTAATAPDRFTHLALASPAGFGRDLVWWFRLLGLDVMATLMPLTVSRRGVRSFMQQVFYDRSLIEEAEVERLWRQQKNGASTATFHRLARLTLGLSGVKEDFLISEAQGQAISARTLVIWGEHDRILPVHHVARAKRLIPHATTVVLPRVGHCPQLEAHETFNRHLIAFLQGVTLREEPVVPALAAPLSPELLVSAPSTSDDAVRERQAV